jgi:hypothetical protein
VKGGGREARGPEDGENGGTNEEHNAKNEEQTARNSKTSYQPPFATTKRPPQPRRCPLPMSLSLPPTTIAKTTSTGPWHLFGACRVNWACRSRPFCGLLLSLVPVQFTNLVTVFIIAVYPVVSCAVMNARQCKLRIRIASYPTWLIGLRLVVNTVHTS